jgi:hypothetical protein
MCFAFDRETRGVLPKSGLFALPLLGVSSGKFFFVFKIFSGNIWRSMDHGTHVLVENPMCTKRHEAENVQETE